MLLLELSEVIDRHGNYGQWIDTRSGKVYPVKDKQGHEDVIVANARQLFPGDDDIVPSWDGKGVDLQDYDKFTELAYSKDFLRIEHTVPEIISFSGTRTAFKKALPIIRGSIGQQDILAVNIDIEEEVDWKFRSVYSNQFRLPVHRIELTKFINSL